MEHATASHTDILVEQILSHVSENSWLNIVDLDGWAGGITDDPTAAEVWHSYNVKPKPNYWKAWECGTEEAAKISAYFTSLGLPLSIGSSSSGKSFYIYKTSI